MVSPGAQPGQIMDLIDMELDMDWVNVGDGNEPDVRENTREVIAFGIRAKLDRNFLKLPNFTFKILNHEKA